MSDKDHVLNLDELFGTKQPVIVNWQGKRFELTRPEGMNPIQHRDFSKFEKQLLEKKLDENTDPVELDRLMRDLIKILNPALVEHNPPYTALIKILEFYQAQVLPDSGKDGASNSKKADPSTGEGPFHTSAQFTD